MSALLVAVVGAPLAVAGLLCLPAARPAARGLAPWAAVPALLAVVVVPESAASDFPRFFLGMRLGLDPFGSRLLFASALLWTAAGVAARTRFASDPHACRFAAFWLLALAGNFWVLAALDAASLCAGFALMTFAAYGLIAHESAGEACFAGRVYLVLALLGDALLLEGLLLRTSANADLLLPWAEVSDDDAAAGAFVFFGLGVKAGVAGLHMWQPLAYRVVPGAVAAVLSSALAGAALLGWVRLLPLGAAALPGLGVVAAGFGLAGAFGAALLASVQREPKVVLAYAGVGQVGLAAAALGVALTAPAACAPLAPVLANFAVQFVLAIGVLHVLIGALADRDRAPRAQRPLLAAAALAALALATCTPVAVLLARAEAASVLTELPEAWRSALAILAPLAVAAAAAAPLRLLLALRGLPADGKRPVPHEAALPAGDVIVPVAPLAELIWRRILAAAAWPDRSGPDRSGRNGAERAAIAARRLEALLRRFAAAGASMIALLAAVTMLLWR